MFWTLEIVLHVILIFSILNYFVNKDFDLFFLRSLEKYFDFYFYFIVIKNIVDVISFFS